MVFPYTGIKARGRDCPRPEEAVKKYRGLEKDWLIPHPKLPYEVLGVSLSPGRKSGKEGYFVRKEIRYR